MAGVVGARNSQFLVFALYVGRGRGSSGVGCDIDFGGHSAFEGVFVEGVEEALELVSVFPYFAEGHCVDYQGEEECDPGAVSG